MVSPKMNNSKLIVVCSATGGVGRTAITVNLATALARQSLKVRVIDTDFQFGDISLAFDLHPNHSIKEVAERKDIENVKAYLLNHESGVDVLPAPDRPEYAELITADFLNEIIDTLQEDSEILLVETQAGLNELTIQLMEKADQILVIGTPRMASLKNSKLFIETLDMLHLKDKARLVINKLTSPAVIKPNTIPELTKIERITFLPYEEKQMDRSLDLGKPLITMNPKLAFSKEVEKLAALLDINRQGAENKKTKKAGLFSKVKMKDKNKDKVKGSQR
ncbi:AAA family ATPase [Virgibacillus sp. C22-A2]|uniref:AAA family ATPase n=1 Tax=Virgibacillus tibetensis TaxID=3042313 RepID=A0ABU6KCB6_9BACI|nr:AAA family ATPase [Virgibacillus sp. C22-A2]